MAEPLYVVMVLHQRDPIDKTMEYVGALNYDPYQKCDGNRLYTTPDREDAFVFRTLAAAEVIAATVGGVVEYG